MNTWETEVLLHLGPVRLAPFGHDIEVARQFCKFVAAVGGQAAPELAFREGSCALRELSQGVGDRLDDDGSHQ